MAKRKFHAVADIFPRMPEEDFKSLVANIKEQGLLVPIKVDPDGLIIDGRHRYEACEQNGVDPVFETVDLTDLEDLISYVASLNAQRRDLTKSQRAMAAAEAWTLLEKAEGERRGGDRRSKNQKLSTELLNGKASKHFAKIHGTSFSLVEQARVVLKDDPVGATAIKSGNGFVGAAYESIRQRQRELEGSEKQLEYLGQDAPDLAERVKAGKMTPDQASQALHKRKDEARQRSAAVMEIVHDALQAVGTASVNEIWQDWDEGQYPEGGERLTVGKLRNASAVLGELADRMEAKKGRKK